jgi:predicted DNA-binding protein (UPF0251 family)
MSAVKRHPTETIILAALEKSRIDPKSFPLILDCFRGELTQSQIGEKYGLARNTVTERFTRAKKRIKEFMPGGIWIEFEGSRMPVSLVRKLGELAHKLDATKDEDAKREVLKILDTAIAEASACLDTSPDLPGLK